MPRRRHAFVHADRLPVTTCASFGISIRALNPHPVDERSPSSGPGAPEPQSKTGDAFARESSSVCSPVGRASGNPAEHLEIGADAAPPV